MLPELINSLTDEERNTLRTRIAAESQVNRLIAAYLENPAITKKELQSNYGISASSYFKNLSLAKNEIYEVIKLHLRNAYDDLILANVLYRRGLEVHASKLRIKLAEDYECHGWWTVLQELHNLDMMVAYAKCDIKWLEKQKTKIFANQERINRFTRIDKEVIVQMAIIEKGDLEEKNFPAFGKSLNILMAEARDLGHPIPIFNALHTLYVFHTKYDVDMERAAAIIAETPKFLKKYDKSLIAYTKSVAWLNTVSFLVDFEAGKSPEPYFRHLENAIGNHGLLFDAQAMLSFCHYYFLQKNTAMFGKYYDRFIKLPSDKSFQYKIAYLNCLGAYLRNDGKEFNAQKNSFYTDGKNRAYDDYDLTIRNLEMLMLLKAEEKPLAADKLEAAMKFTRRNFTSSRIKAEKLHWHFMNAAIHDKPIGPKFEKVFTFSSFIYNELQGMGGGNIKRP